MNARADLFRSLGTGDKLEAKRRLPAKLVEMREAFVAEEAALLSSGPELREPSEHELQAEAFDLVRRECWRAIKTDPGCALNFDPPIERG